MTFSVIIPCYNSAETIVMTLDSIVSQSYDDYEILIVDDCSTDNTVEVINKYKLQHNECDIQLYRKEKNSGPGDSRNIALKIANGDYIMFIDSDDCYIPKTFELLHDRIVNENADIVCYGDRLEIGSKVHHRFPYESTDKRKNMALRGGSLCSFTASRKIWKGIELPPIKYAEDIAVVPILFMRSTKIVVINDCLYRYIFRQNSLSSKKNKSISDSFCKSFEATLQYMECNDYAEEIEFHGVKTILYGAVLNAFQADMSLECIKKYIYDFEKLYPSWYENKYIAYYPKRKRFFLKMVKNRSFLFLRLYVMMQNAYLKFFA